MFQRIPGNGEPWRRNSGKAIFLKKSGELSIRGPLKQ
jgi:hypothetical protein